MIPRTGTPLLRRRFRLRPAAEALEARRLMADDVGDMYEAATPLTLGPDVSVTFTGSFEVGSDVDYFRIPLARDVYEAVLTAEVPAGLQILFDPYNPVGEGTVRNVDRHRSIVGILGHFASNEVLVQAHAGGSHGPYSLTIRPLAETSDDPARPRSVDVNPDGTATIVDEIESRGDVDYFRFTAPITGRIAVEWSGWVEAEFGVDGPAPGLVRGTGRSGDDRVFDYQSSSFEAEASVTYPFFVVTPSYPEHLTSSRDQSHAAGSYRITIGPETGQTREAARVVPVGDDGRASLPDRFEAAGDVDWFRFRVPRDGRYTVGPKSGDGYFGPRPHSRESYQILDASGVEIRTDGTSIAHLDARAGEVYFVRVRAAEDLDGPLDYAVIVRPETPDAPAASVPIDLGFAGAAVDDFLERPGDVDTYSFTAVRTGLLIARIRHASRSARVELLGPDGTAVPTAGAPQSVYNNKLGEHTNTFFQVVAGTRYTVLVHAALNVDDSRYRLEIEDNAALGLLHAIDLALDPSGRGSYGGTFPRQEFDLVRITSPVPRRLTAFVWPFTLEIDVLDDHGAKIAELGSSRPRTSIDLGAGQSVYLRLKHTAPLASEANVTYSLGVAPLVDEGDTPATALPIQVGSDGGGLHSGMLGGGGDVDFLRLVAPRTGTMTITAPTGPDLTLAVHESSHRWLAGGRESVTVAVQAGQTYLVYVTGAGLIGESGPVERDTPYSLRFQTALPAPPPTPPAPPTPPSDATPPTLVSTRLVRVGRRNLAIELIFSEPIGWAALADPAGYRVTLPGRDRRHGTRDDSSIRLAGLTLGVDGRTARLLLPIAAIPPQGLRLAFDGSRPNALADLTGNRLAIAANDPRLALRSIARSRTSSISYLRSR